MMEKKFVEVVTYTWSKDSHGLFDYESPHLSTCSFKIGNSAQFYRRNNEILMLDTSSTISNPLLEQSQSLLFNIYQDPAKSDGYFISLKNPSTLLSNVAPPSIDLVVRAIKKDGLPAGYELKMGDIIKIGRVKFLIREIKDANNVVNKIRNVQEVNFLTQDHENLDNELMTEENSHTSDKTHTEINCRICLMSNLYPDPLDNTLVSPCKCKGSCEYVHLKCLKQWIDSKKSTIENSESICLSFNYKKLSCEICKENLPYTLKLGMQEYDIIDIKKPINMPYMVIEKVENMRENKGLFLIKASDQDVRLGRGHTHHILVSDISVSRNHAYILYKEGKFLLFDNNSKFGTLVQIEQPIEISSEKTILQCGKTVIILSIKKEEESIMPTNVGIGEEGMNSPQTPSTSNEQDAESKLTASGSEKVKKAEKKMRKNQRRIRVRVEESKEEDDELIDLTTLKDKAETVTTLLKNSKKIFKVMKSEESVEEIDLGAKKGVMRRAKDKN